MPSTKRDQNKNQKPKLEEAVNSHKLYYEHNAITTFPKEFIEEKHR